MLDSLVRVFKTGVLKAFCQLLEGAVPEGLKEHLSILGHWAGTHSPMESCYPSRNSRC